MNSSRTRASLSSAAEVAVVTLAAGGDDEAFAELVRRRQSWLRTLLRRMCRDPALADDISQQAFILAWRKIRQLKAPAAFSGWLRILAVNLCLQALRSQQKGQLDEESGADVAALPAVSTDPSTAMDLDRLLMQLRPAERVCVVLCHAEGMSHAEITAATGWPPGTVKSHISRGAARLRALLGEESP